MRPEPENDGPERIRTLLRINRNLSEQVEYLSELYMLADNERRRLERRYLVVRPFAFVRKAAFLLQERLTGKRPTGASGSR